MWEAGVPAFTFLLIFLNTFFSKSADTDTEDVKLPPTVYFFSWFYLVYTFKIVHVNQHGFCPSNLQT